MTEESFGTAGDRPGCGCLSLVLVITFAAAAAVIWAVNDAAPARDRDGALTESATVPIEGLRVGDCVNISLDGDEVAAISPIPCSEPHDAQVYAFGDVSAGTIPERRR